MTTYPFATITTAEANSFSVEVDFVSFSVGAALILVQDYGNRIDVTAQGRLVSFPFGANRLAFDNFTFPDGSRFIWGDQDIQTAADDLANNQFGTGAGDLMFGRGGGDVMSGENGADVMYGNQGSDTMYGGDGTDTMDGGADGDSIDGGSGRT